MKGTLLGAFCERGGHQPTRCLELWSYPDLTINVVVNYSGADGEVEYCFPCALYHLINVLRFKRYRMVNPHGVVVLERNDGHIFAEFTSPAVRDRWVHDVPIHNFVHALARVAPEVSGLVEDNN